MGFKKICVNLGLSVASEFFIESNWRFKAEPPSSTSRSSNENIKALLFFAAMN
jgi:hypothetical protein